MRTIWMTQLLLLAAILLPGAAIAQTPCDRARSTELFVLPPDATGASYVFSYPALDVPGIAHYTLRIYRADAQGQPEGASLSQQTVTPAATSAIGVMQGDPAQTCYALPVVPVAQIPRGVPVVVTLVAVGSVTALASAESEPSDPLGSRLTPPVVRVRP